jgi:hypothetical protein
MFRSSLSYYYNWNRGENNQPLDRQDFWPLSYDKPRVESDTEMDEEDKAQFLETIKRLESKSKRKKNSG